MRPVAPHDTAGAQVPRREDEHPRRERIARWSGQPGPPGGLTNLLIDHAEGAIEYASKDAVLRPERVTSPPPL